MRRRLTTIFYGMMTAVISGCISEVDTPEIDSEEIASIESAVGSPAMIPGSMPFYSEFDASENPHGYDWCAHGAFKVVYKYQTGKYISLTTIDQLLTQMYGNYSLCGSQKCSSDTQILGIARNKLSLPNSVMRKTTNMTEFFNKVKDGIYFNYPPIVGSYVDPYGPWGHYWVIVGYKDTGNINTSVLYLRNVALDPSTPWAPYDTTRTVPEFYKSWNSKAGTWYYANDLLFIKP